MSKYEIIIFWSKEDEAYVAEMPELKGCVAHGDTQEEALREVNTVAKEWWTLPLKKDGRFPSLKANSFLHKLLLLRLCYSQ